MKFSQTLLALALAAGLAVPAAAQQPAAPRATPGTPVRLSLDEAVRIAQAQSQPVDIARSGVTRATGQRALVRSQYLPQLNGTAGYTKTLKSQFSDFASSGSSDSTSTPTSQSICTPFVPANATAEARAAALAQAASCPSSSGGGFDLSKTSFGATNQWALGLSFSQNIYSGGRIRAQNDAANAQLRSADIEVLAQRAQVSLDITSAYYDAVLADQLVAIADSSISETNVVLSQTKLAKQVGNASEYELLRAQVAHDNEIPASIRARANRQVAYFRVKQLLNMSLDDSLSLTTGIEGDTGPTLPALVANVAPDTARNQPCSGTPAGRGHPRIGSAGASRARRTHSIPGARLELSAVVLPANGIPSLGNGVNNWTVGVSTNFPLLDGGRTRADALVAQAGVQQARAQREQTRQFAALDTRVALNALQEAQASWEASRGTTEQAQRAYAIDQVRYREGISTQTDLTQSRLLLEQARANRALAARDLAVARVRLALLRDLPLQAAGASFGAGAGTSGQQQQQQQQQQQLTQQRSSRFFTDCRWCWRHSRGHSAMIRHGRENGNEGSAVVRNRWTWRMTAMIAIAATVASGCKGRRRDESGNDADRHGGWT
jgi:outer membrane protein TolC